MLAPEAGLPSIVNVDLDNRPPEAAPEQTRAICGGARYTIAVRELCEFAAKTGDLDLRFTPSPSAQEGIAGHRTVAARRNAADADHRAEVVLAGTYGPLTVRGRADGYDARLGRVEEVKTHKGDLGRLPDNQRALHWAQAKVYAWLLCERFELPALDVRLVYFDITTEVETPFTEACSAAALRQHFEALCGRFLGWAERELTHRRARDAWLAGLRFPHAGFRPGQRQLADQTYLAALRGGSLLAQAPTGIGKTLGTLFPMLKAMPVSPLDKIFFLTAKRSGRRVALDALQTLTSGEGGSPVASLRVLELVARERACEHPQSACRGVSCPLARGFYDRLPAARSEAVEQSMLSREATRATALTHGICPYWLQQELVRWADIVVGDFNHQFDANAVLHALTRLNDWRIGVLVDEAHNLVERGRAMYSSELDAEGLAAAVQSAPDGLGPSLRRIERAWHVLIGAQTVPYQAHDSVPAPFADALRGAIAAIGDWLVEQDLSAGDPLLRFYFDALRFAALSESFGAHSVFDVSIRRPGKQQLSNVPTADAAVSPSTLCIRNIVPAPFLRKRFDTARATVLFSATLTPVDFYRDLLGTPPDTRWLEVQSPFDARQLQVRIAGGIPTRLDRREHSLLPIARLIGGQYAAAPGNYLAFFSSFDYLARAFEIFRTASPTVPAWRQTREMKDADREAFVERFTEHGRGIGFAVLGGAFAEGIDLPGRRLVGAFITTLGLPPFNPVNERIRQTLEATFGAGKNYTYLYPGLRKVVQAAGRVIRTLDDQGHLILIDPRFGRSDVRALLPGWWAPEVWAGDGANSALDFEVA